MVIYDVESSRGGSYSGGSWRRVSLGPLEAGGWTENADRRAVSAGVRELRKCRGATPVAGRCRRPGTGTGRGHTRPFGCLDRGRGSSDEFILRFCTLRNGGIVLSAREFWGGSRRSSAHSPCPGLMTSGPCDGGDSLLFPLLAGLRYSLGGANVLIVSNGPFLGFPVTD